MGEAGSVLMAAVGDLSMHSLPAAALPAPDAWSLASDVWVVADLLILIGFLLALLATFALAVVHGRDHWKYVSIFFAGAALSCGCGLIIVQLGLIRASGLPLFLLQCAAGLFAMISVLTLWPALAGAAATPNRSSARHNAPLEPGLPLRTGPGGPLSLEDALSGIGATMFARGEDLSERWSTALPGEMVGDAALPSTSFAATLKERISASFSSAFSRKEAVATNFQIEDARGNPRWYELTVQPGVFTDGQRGAVGCLFDVTRFRQPEAECRSLLQEATHRAKNLLTVIQSVVRMSAKTLNLPPATIEPFNARLQSVALAYDLLVREEWEGVALPDLLRSQLGHALGGAVSRASWSGPPLRLRPSAVQTLALAFHELAVKAEAQGALSLPEGSLRVWWETVSLKDGSEGYRLVWQETGGPAPDQTAERKTFSRDILERLTPRGLRGEVSSAYTEEGFRWEVRFPATNILPTN
ncbi:sensor histidine kinase [Pedomonas mirosovicensis]|uniref:sensor histidine kinase n=1 Tax=Pedomonas mirosovicensis TaxID=2908641 RepID=UPI00216A6D62|nr:sensor histidine kinase [Pedomonas mirosovicensis]MCH8685848.1 sensor histidine kinase [Pedomonas mirosovicensis]